MHKLIEKSNFSHSCGKLLLWIYLILSQYTERGFAYFKLELGEKILRTEFKKKKTKQTFKRRNKYSYHYRKKHKFNLPEDQNLSEIFY